MEIFTAQLFHASSSKIMCCPLINVERDLYSQTPLRAYRPWTDFLSLKWDYREGRDIVPYDIVLYSV